MNVQPIEHGADTAAQPQSTKAAITAAQKKQSPRADAARIANAKISRRKSLKKQRRSSEGFRWRAASGRGEMRPPVHAGAAITATIRDVVRYVGGPRLLFLQAGAVRPGAVYPDVGGVGPP
jgi:hypothetical protein